MKDEKIKYTYDGETNLYLWRQKYNRFHDEERINDLPHNLEQAHKLLAGHGIKPSWLKLVSSKGDHYYGLSYYASANGKDEHLAFARALLAGMGLTVFYSEETITIKI